MIQGVSAELGVLVDSSPVVAWNDDSVEGVDQINRLVSSWLVGRQVVLTFFRDEALYKARTVLIEAR